MKRTRQAFRRLFVQNAPGGLVILNPAPQHLHSALYTAIREFPAVCPAGMDQRICLTENCFFIILLNHSSINNYPVIVMCDIGIKII